MELLIQILALFCTILAIFSGLFLCFAQPIWGIIDAAVSPKLSSGAKVAIILLTMLLLGPVMTFFYALIGTQSRVFRNTTIAAGVLFVASFVSVLTLAALAPAPAAVVPPDATVNAETFVGP